MRAFRAFSEKVAAGFPPARSLGVACRFGSMLRRAKAGSQKMRPLKKSGVRVGLAAMAAGLMLGQGQALAADSTRGKLLFTQKYGCFGCHGTEGQGSPVTGPKLAPNPLPYDALASFVRTSNGAMPPFREAILPNEDLADIYAYLQSIKPGPDYKSIPLLNSK
jgi:mono/diheme cytochrome c family protein